MKTTEEANNSKSKKELWEYKAKVYNSIFDFLENKGLKEKDLIEFSVLLRAYIHSI